MSEPFVPNTTAAIERANRLISVQTHPGFIDIIRISQEMVQTAQDICTDYGGWDAAQIVVLKVRAQAAKEHHVALLAKIRDAIQAGVEESRTLAQTLPEKTPEEIVEQGDYVRQKTLETFEDMDMRPAGSY